MLFFMYSLKSVDHSSSCTLGILPMSKPAALNGSESEGVRAEVGFMGPGIMLPKDDVATSVIGIVVPKPRLVPTAVFAPSRDWSALVLGAFKFTLVLVLASWICFPD